MMIAYLSNSTIPSKTANSVHVMKMCSAFCKNGNDVVLYAKLPKVTEGTIENVFDYYGVDNSFRISGISAVDIRGFGSLSFALKVSNEVKDSQLPDIFYGRDAWSLFFTMSTNIPIIYEAHALPNSGAKRIAESLLFRSMNFKRLVVISEALKKEYLKAFPTLNEQKVMIAHDGANIPLGMSQKNKVPNDIIRVGYVGHLYPGRGINVIEDLARHFPQVEFHIVGGTEEDIKYWSQETSDISNMIFHGFVPNGELHKKYELFDILLAPYQRKVSVAGGTGDTSKWMSPLKIFEYMSFKKPMVVSDLPVLREVLKHEVNCLFCDPEDINSWVLAISRLIDAPELRNTLAEKAFSDLCTHYTWDIRAQNVID
ncbi:MAG TPA: hypothetical protein DIW17_19525 [Clostridiales bacterium]|nr:hypothetical protein [Clostridiales bacterium]